MDGGLQYNITRLPICRSGGWRSCKAHHRLTECTRRGADLCGAMQALGCFLGEEDLADGVIAQLGGAEGADDLYRLQALPATAEAVNHLLRICARQRGADCAGCMAITLINAWVPHG